MKIVRVTDPKRVDRKPDKTISLISSADFNEQGIIVKNLKLCLYIQKIDEKLGPYSLITCLIETDKGEIEMTYDEGYRGPHALEEVTSFLTSHLGLSSLILRSVLQLKSEMKEDNT